MFTLWQMKGGLHDTGENKRSVSKKHPRPRSTEIQKGRRIYAPSQGFFDTYSPYEYYITNALFVHLFSRFVISLSSFTQTVIKLHIVSQSRVPLLVRLGTRNRETIRHNPCRIIHPPDIKHREDISLLLAERC